MTGMRSAFVLAVLLGTQGCFGATAVAASDEPARAGVVADDQPAPDAGLRKRAEDLARAASERFSEIMGSLRRPRLAQGTAPQAQGTPRTPGATDDAFAPVWGWLARAAKDYEDVIVAKFRNPSGEVVILAPQGAVVAQKDAVPEVPEKRASELPPVPVPELSWGWVMETARDWLARANRSYRNEIVKQLKQPPAAGTPWPPAEVVPQAPSPADVAAEAEAERHAAEVRRAAEEAQAQRRQQAEAQRQAEAAEATRKADDAKRVADEAEAKRKADAEAKRVADEAEAKRVADEAEAKRKAEAEAKRVADEAEAKRKADAEAKRVADEAEAKRVADEAEAKRKADAEAKRLADEAEAKRKADAEAKRVADEAEAKRVADEAEAKRRADAETARRLKEEGERERKAVAEAEATRLATEAEAKRAAAAGLKPAHENSSVAVAPPPAQPAPAKAPTLAEQDRKAREEAVAAEPVPPKVVKKKRRAAANYAAHPKKGKRAQLAASKHGHKYAIVEARAPKRIVHAYRQKPDAAPPLTLRSRVYKAPACACPHAYRAPKPKRHRIRVPAAPGYAAPRVWRACGEDLYFRAHRKARHPNLIFHRSRLYISPERR